MLYIWICSRFCIIIIIYSICKFWLIKQSRPYLLFTDFHKLLICFSCQHTLISFYACDCLSGLCFCGTLLNLCQILKIACDVLKSFSYNSLVSLLTWKTFNIRSKFYRYHQITSCDLFCLVWVDFHRETRLPRDL